MTDAELAALIRENEQLKQALREKHRIYEAWKKTVTRQYEGELAALRQQLDDARRAYDRVLQDQAVGPHRH